MTTFIEQYENYLPLTVCNQACNLIDLSIDKDLLIYTDQPGRKDYKVSSGKIKELRSIESNIFDVVYKGWKEYNHKYGVTAERFDKIFDIDWNFQKSEPNGGFTGWHCEQTYQENLQSRFAVWMIYLNTIDTGFTDFKHQGLSIQPTAGTLVIWPAGFTHMHRSNPKLNDSKYIATGWFTYQ